MARSVHTLEALGAVKRAVGSAAVSVGDMEWEISFATDPPMIGVRAWGVAAHEGFVAYFNAIMSDSRWQPHLPVLIDFTALDLSGLSSDDLRKLVAAQAPHGAELRKSRVALVVARPVDFGVARMWEVLSEDLFPTQRVFYDVDEARAWVTGAPSSPKTRAAKPPT